MNNLNDIYYWKETYSGYNLFEKSTGRLVVFVQKGIGENLARVSKDVDEIPTSENNYCSTYSAVVEKSLGYFNSDQNAIDYVIKTLE